MSELRFLMPVVVRSQEWVRKHYPVPENPTKERERELKKLGTIETVHHWREGIEPGERHFPAGSDWTAVDDELPLDGKAGEVPVWFRFADGYELVGIFERQDVRPDFPYPYERFSCRHHPIHGCEWWWAKPEQPTQNAPRFWRYRNPALEEAFRPPVGSVSVLAAEEPSN